MQRVYVQSFGCRASQADGAAIEASFEDRGLEPVGNAADADLIVLNTCTVTHSADVDTRRIIRGIHRDHPKAEILVTGCYAQRAPAELAAMDSVRWVVGNTHKARIADLVTVETQGHEYHGAVFAGDISAQRAFTATPVRGTRDDRTRPNLKIQDGCGNRCSFCIIPSVRGRSRSATIDSVIEQVRQLAQSYREVVLTGINLGRWGRDFAGRRELRLADLLRTLLCETPVGRLRISSVEPMDWSQDLLEFVAAEGRIAKHVHIPLQSGSDSVLKRMARKYRARHYADRVGMARKLMPDGAIGADVMTGFPGETEAEFEETVQFVTTQPLTYLHVFTYSERPGTRAAEMPNRVAIEVRHKRTHILRELSLQKEKEFLQSMLGKRLPAVTLEKRGLALTSNFLKVELAQNREPNRLVDLEIGGLSEAGLRERSMFSIVGQ